MARMEGRVAEKSDHYPVSFKAVWKIEKVVPVRRIPKTLLQSRQMKEGVGAVYDISLRDATEQLNEVLKRETVQITSKDTQASIEAAHVDIREPWEKQVRKRRRKSGPTSTLNCFDSGHERSCATTGGSGAASSKTKGTTKRLDGRPNKGRGN